MTEGQMLDNETIEILQAIGETGIVNAANGFGKLLGRNIEVHKTSVRLIPLLEIAGEFESPEQEAVGIYLRAEGDISGQIMLIIPYTKSLELVDLLMGDPIGTADSLGKLERSALGELGNQTGTFFLNAVADMAGMSLRPTPPAVMVDMVGAIVDIIIATTGGVSDHVLLIEANFADGSRIVETNFWVLPDAQSIQVLKRNVKKQ